MVEEITAWFDEQIPDDWYDGSTRTLVDRDEHPRAGVTVEIVEPEVKKDAGPEKTAKAQ